MLEIKNGTAMIVDHLALPLGQATEKAFDAIAPEGHPTVEDATLLAGGETERRSEEHTSELQSRP